MDEHAMNRPRLRNSLSIHTMLERDRNDPVAWKAFFERYWEVARKWAAIRTGDEILAEDVASLVILKMFQTITNPLNELVKLQGGSLKPYLATVMGSVIADYYRALNRPGTDPTATDGEAPPSAERPRPRAVDLSAEDLASLGTRDAIEDLERRWDDEERLERVMASHFDRYRVAIQELKADPQFSEDTFRVFLAIRHEGRDPVAEDDERGYETGTASRTVRRIENRLLRRIWGRDGDPGEPGERELLREMVKTHGDPSL